MSGLSTIIAAVAALTITACEAIVSNPREEAPSGETGIELEVLSCDVNEFGATATVQLQSSKAWSLVSLKGEITDTSGAVVGQGFGNATALTESRRA
jgi:hypothetical protein